MTSLRESRDGQVVRFIKGLLDGPPAVALTLSKDNCDFGANDLMGTPIEEMVPGLWHSRPDQLPLSRT